MNGPHQPYGGEPASLEGRSARPVSNDAKPRQMRLAIAVIAVAVIAFLLIAFMTFRSCGRAVPYDADAEEGQLRGKTSAEIQAELDRQVEEGMFNISIASVVEFADGDSEGELRIENVPGNRYDMQVTIADDSTGEVYYQTNLIRPDQHIQKDKLLKDLDPGTYECTAVFTAYDKDTAEEVGRAAARISIVVYG